MSPLGEVVRRERQRLGWSQDALAAAVAAKAKGKPVSPPSQSTLSKLERGTLPKPLDAAQLEVLEQALQLPPGRLVAMAFPQFRRRDGVSVEEAIATDPALSPEARAVLLETYRFARGRTE